MGTIILYYQYITIQYPKRIQKWQEKICADLNLKGRIIIAHEGINGTLGGSVDSIEKYKQIMRSNELFATIDFKESRGDSTCFVRLQIKIKDEIVRFGIDPNTLTTEHTGIHLTPRQTHERIGNAGQNMVIFDARNEYESQVGAFKNAIKPPIKYFRQLPAYIDANLEQFKDKDVIMYCTGGVRCERASAYLKLKGVAKQVYQMEGGIHRYIEQYPNGFFEGKNYVFDNRLVVKANDTVLGLCSLCNNGEDEYTNCLHAACNKHFICCAACLETLKGMCSKDCYDLVYLHHAPQRPSFNRVKIAL